MLIRSIALAVLALLTLGSATFADSRLPDEGIRRRLDGCFNVAQLEAKICFDGVERVVLEFKGPKLSGTYTVLGGRALFDFSPEANPANEIYPSCDVSISSEQTPTEFGLSACMRWEYTELPDGASMDGQIRAERETRSWLLAEIYEQNGASTFDASLEGCWERLRSRERQQFLKENPQYLSYYEICFLGEKSGQTTSVAVDASDGWDSAGAFAMVGDRLALRSEPRDDSELRCSIAVGESHLSMFNCAYWGKDSKGRMVPRHADDPMEFVRKEPRDDG